MNLYRSLGHKWAGTQADARAANNGDKDFEHIDVPTDKAGLLQFLNEMEARLTPLSITEPEPITADDPQWTEGEYHNGLPTTPFNKSRDPAAVFNCTSCGHQNRNQGR